MEVSQHFAVIAAFVAGLSCMFLIRMAWSFILGSAQLVLFFAILVGGVHLFMPDVSQEAVTNSASAGFEWAQKNFYLASDLVQHFSKDGRFPSFASSERANKKVELTRISSPAPRR